MNLITSLKADNASISCNNISTHRRCPIHFIQHNTVRIIHKEFSCKRIRPIAVNPNKTTVVTLVRVRSTIGGHQALSRLFSSRLTANHDL